MTTICEDLKAITHLPRPQGGCDECLAVGDTWVHLRYCTSCGNIGCCDDSRNTHARRHAQAHGHAVIRSLEPDEYWGWCYTHSVGMRLPPEEG